MSVSETVSVLMQALSIKQIADASPDTVEGALKDAKAVKALQNACKAAVKRATAGGAAVGGVKRPGTAFAEGTESKRARHSPPADFLLGPTQMTPQELEASLALPVTMDEERIADTVLLTNRAPVVLAFAVELLRYTMPEQPMSSRLSLAQAVVSANSRSKAVSIGLEAGASADDEGWGEGQPRVRILGREIAVLKRGGYEWKGEEVVGETETQKSTTRTAASQPLQAVTSEGSWSASQAISLKQSTFIARATSITEPSQRQALVRALMEANPALKTATHNAWAYRTRPPASGSSWVREDSFDDGETGCGDLMLRVMREVGAVDTLVVLSRWFGGVLLGPDRWRLMRNSVTGALAERLRRTGTEAVLGGEAVWGLDLEGMRSKSHAGSHGSGVRHHETTVVGTQIHKPEAARNYLLKSFASVASSTDQEDGKGKPTTPKKKTTLKAQGAEKEENLGLLLGALRMLYDSWADHVSAAELDRRAWGWYVAVRPDVAGGPSGWGVKSSLKLRDILGLRRPEVAPVAAAAAT